MLLLALTLPTVSACVIQQEESAAAVEFKYQYEDYVETFSGFKAVSDTEKVTFADGILDGTLYVSELFEGMPYDDVSSIDWNASFTESANTFQLYLQGLASLEVLGQAYRVNGNVEYLTFGQELIESWIDYAGDQNRSGDNPILWHDHGTAIRTESLIYFMLTCMGTEVDTPQFRTTVYEQLVTHASFLADSANYTENHNHGVIQDIALLHAAYFIDYHECDTWIATAEERLTSQKEFAFNAEMVHVENSPGYNAAIIDSFYSVSQFLARMGDEFAEELDADIYEAAEFLAWVTMPNGITAQIGDTSSSSALEQYSLKYEKFGNPRLDFTSSLGRKDELSAEQKAVTTKFYPDAGYFFYRSAWSQEDCKDATWKMFKAGYSSRTHKHADDISFMLYSKGYEVFTDTGWYNYMSGTPYRSYFISSSAHNTVTVDEKSYSPTVENAGKTGMLFYDETDTLDHVLAFNDMYQGTEIDRHFYSSGDLTVLYDNICSDEVHTYTQLFHLAENIEIQSMSDDETVLSIADTGYLVRIRQFVPAELEVEVGRTEAQPLYGHISRSINEVEDTETLRYIQTASDTDYITLITIEDPDGMVSLKDGTEVHYSDITFDSNTSTLKFLSDVIEFIPRTRLDLAADVKIDSAKILSAAIIPNEDCLYAYYLINAESGEAFYKSEFSDSSQLTYDLSGETEDVLIKGYVRSTQYPQRKSAILAALVYDEDSMGYTVDSGEKYPFLNLQYYGHHFEQVSKDTYNFVIEYDYSWDTTQRWYVYRNGSYYTVLQTKNESSLEYTFTEPGEYTISYYLRTANGDYEFWDFPVVTIE